MMRTEMCLYLFLLECLRNVTTAKIWKTLYMDKDSDCYKTFHNDDMAERDVYVVKSDSWRGGSPWASRPSECSLTFNFDNRIVGARNLQWWCDESVNEPFLAFYDDCLESKRNLMEWHNCSSAANFVALESSSSCISIYHYRGHTKAGYYFTIKISAEKEVLSFPAGGYAAIVIISIAIILVVVKVTCSLYDWIRRSRELDFRLVGAPVDCVEKECSPAKNRSLAKDSNIENLKKAEHGRLLKKSHNSVV